MGGPPQYWDQEEGQVGDGLGQILGIERAQQRVTDHPEVEAIDQGDEEGLAAHPIEQCVHGIDGRRSRLPPDSRP